MKWLKELDEDMFKEFILEQYAEWLEIFMHVNCERIDENPDNQDLWERGREIGEEQLKVRGMY